MPDTSQPEPSTLPATECRAVTETRLVHEVHRIATSLLAEAAARSGVPLSALAELRDFLVANLRHHHETEDGQLWPLITSAAPEIIPALTGLSAEHARLDDALDTLAGYPIERDADRVGLETGALTVRAVLHGHLEHEEPVLFPALRDHVAPADWDRFAQQVIATSPTIAAHLMIGFLDQAGTTDEVAMMLADLPEPVQSLVPVLREQAEADFRVLQG